MIEQLWQVLNTMTFDVEEIGMVLGGSIMLGVFVNALFGDKAKQQDMLSKTRAIIGSRFGRFGLLAVVLIVASAFSEDHHPELLIGGACLLTWAIAGAKYRRVR